MARKGSYKKIPNLMPHYSRGFKDGSEGKMPDKAGLKKFALKAYMNGYNAGKNLPKR